MSGYLREGGSQLRRLRTSGVLACVGAVLCAPARAQDVILEEIVVTARKRTESVQDIPEAITVFSGSRVEDSGITRIKDVADLTPNLVVRQSYRMGVVNLSARGLATPALCVIVFATWTSNANNLYSMSLGLATIFDGIDKWRLTVAAGVAGTLVAMAGVTDVFIPSLLTLGIAIPPVAGVYLADYFAVKGARAYSEPADPLERAVSPAAFAAWIIATAVGAITARDLFSVTHILACDSFLSAVAVYWVAHRLFRPGTATNHGERVTRKSLLRGRE